MKITKFRSKMVLFHAGRMPGLGAARSAELMKRLNVRVTTAENLEA